MIDFFQSRISFEQPVQSFEDEEDDDDDEVSDLFYTNIKRLFDKHYFLNACMQTSHFVLVYFTFASYPESLLQ